MKKKDKLPQIDLPIKAESQNGGIQTSGGIARTPEELIKELKKVSRKKGVIPPPEAENQNDTLPL